MTLISTNPSQNYNVLGEVPSSTAAEIKEVVARAHVAQEKWSSLSLELRIDHIRALAAHLSKYEQEFIRRTSMEMGMPLGLSKEIVTSGLSDMYWHCDHAVKALGDKILFEDDSEQTIQIAEPYGVIGCIVAWNFPFGNFTTSVSQALLAGNAVVMKYSEEVPLFSRYLEEILRASDLPKDLVGFVYGAGDVGAALAASDIDFLSFTGSSATGVTLYQTAASRLMPVSLELGGSSPGIIFEDCIVDDALIETLFWKRFLNTAQFCDGMKRLIVHRRLMDKVVTGLADYAQKRVIGDACDEATELGPLVAERQVLKLEEQIQDALDKGATLHCGGKRPTGLSGAYFEPTVLTGITKDMKVWHEEVFGPALPIISFDTYEQAIELANDTVYGLSGSVFTNDKELAHKAMRDIKAGSIDHTNKSHSAHFYRSVAPFGGYKQSGIGRQSGFEGFHEISQIKIMARIK